MTLYKPRTQEAVRNLKTNRERRYINPVDTSKIGEKPLYRPRMTVYKPLNKKAPDKLSGAFLLAKNCF